MRHGFQGSAGPPQTQRRSIGNMVIPLPMVQQLAQQLQRQGCMLPGGSNLPGGSDDINLQMCGHYAQQNQELQSQMQAMLAGNGNVQNPFALQDKPRSPEQGSQAPSPEGPSPEKGAHGDGTSAAVDGAVAVRPAQQPPQSDDPAGKLCTSDKSAALMSFVEKWKTKTIDVKAAATTSTAGVLVPESVMPAKSAKLLPKGSTGKVAMKAMRASSKSIVKKKEKTKATPTAKKSAGDLSTPTKNKNDGDASKEFDKSWLKAGIPKKYGCVTVYCDRVNQKYRVKDMPGSRKHDMIAWGKTEKDQKSQRKNVQQKVKEYNELMSA